MSKEQVLADIGELIQKELEKEFLDRPLESNRDFAEAVILVAHEMKKHQDLLKSVDMTVSDVFTYISPTLDITLIPLEEIEDELGPLSIEIIPYED